MFETQLKEITVPITLEDSPSAANSSLSIARLSVVDGLSLNEEMGLGKGCLALLEAAMVIPVSVLSRQRTVVSLANTELALSPLLLLCCLLDHLS